MPQCLAATCVAAAMLTAAEATAVAEANSRTNAATQDQELPDAAAVAEAYFMARRWVDEFEVPSFDDPQSHLLIERATGVCVILRSARRVVGVGTAAIGSGSEQHLLVRRAVGRAMAAVLGDPAVQAMPEERRSEIGPSLSLEIEVAGDFQPLLGRDFHRVAQQIEPGLDGVAMRRGNDRAMIFPSQLRAENAAGNIQSRLPGLVTELGLSAGDLASLQQRHSISMHRFRTTHLAQLAPSKFPVETFRGGQVVRLSDVTNESIAAMAHGIASHLVERLWNSSAGAAGEAGESLALGMRGDYDPVRDSYRPIVAPPLDQALAAHALLRYAASPIAQGEQSRRAQDAALRILAELGTVEEGEIDPMDDPAACAVLVIALSSNAGLAGNDDIDRMSQSAQRAISNAFDMDTGFAWDGRSLTPHTQVLVAAAMAQQLANPGSNDDGVDAAVVRAALDAAWSSVPEQQYVSLLPWIGWAEVTYAEAVGEPIANASRLKEVRRALDEARFMFRTQMEPDFAGGYPLATGANVGGNRPTAQASRPAAFFATMLAQPSLTPEEEQPVAREQHRETMRFLMQLTVRDADSWNCRRPEAAVGGARANLWDFSQPTAAQAMVLLAAVETLAPGR